MKTLTLSNFGLAVLALVPLPALGFNSGGTGADGPFNPIVNTELQLPTSGIFNFTSVNIPAGVTVKFRRNTTNTPVVILATGDVNIAGTIDVSGANAAPAGAAGDGNLGDDGVPGRGGPGGYDGGRGGLLGFARAGPGVGPGGGQGGHACAPGGGGPAQGVVAGGAGGSFSAVASSTNSSANYTCGGIPFTAPQGGPTYGSPENLPLVGGSGGGGAAGGSGFVGAGGGGGGGAVLIAASGTVTIADVTGSILANGGRGGDTAAAGAGGNGGGGSGGAIRIIATTVSGNGTLSAQGGAAGLRTATATQIYSDGTAGASGRIRLELENYNRTAASNPTTERGTPGPVFVAGFPTLRITRVAGVDVPAQPTGNGDVILPAATPNPVAVEFASTGVPVGNTVKLTVTPPSGVITTAISNALSGTTQNATASTSINLPTGPSILSAQTTYTIVASLGDELSRYAQGERVEKVRLGAVLGSESTVTLITVSGKEFDVPQAVLAGWGG